jgi:hypothetical protein
VLKQLFARGPEESARAAEQLRHELQLERDRHQREIEAERERRQHELETERERRQNEIEAERERRERDLAAERRDRDTQLALIDRLHRSELENLRTAHAQVLTTKDEQLSRLTDEMRALRSAARQPDTLSDLERMGKVVSAVRTFVPGLAGEVAEEPKTGWERILERAAPLVDRVVENASKPAPVTIYQAAPIPPGFAPRYPALVRPTGSAQHARERMAAVRPSTVSPAQTVAPTAAAAAPADTVGEGLAFLEGAFRGEDAIEEVARSAKESFAASDLQALVAAGPEFLAAEIEKRAPDSLLASSGGKRYLRELVEAIKSQLPAT